MDSRTARQGRGMARRTIALGMVLALSAFLPGPAWAGGKLAWLDEVIQGVVREARGSDGAATAVGRGTTRLFAREAEESLATLAHQADELARSGRVADTASEAILETRFARLVRSEPELARTFSALPAAEKRLVVEMGETARRLALRYPDKAEGMIRGLGTEGLTAVRVWGDDVAEVLAAEGPSAVNVLRKTGRSGWNFFTGTVLPNKKKLAAAGVLTVFVANPEAFIDSAGRITEYAAREFAKAGIALAGAVGQGAARGLESSLAATLDAYGLNFAIVRYVGMGLAGVVVLLAVMVLIGLPIGWTTRPFRWAWRLARGSKAASRPV